MHPSLSTAAAFHTKNHQQQEGTRTQNPGDRLTHSPLSQKRKQHSRQFLTRHGLRLPHPHPVPTLHNILKMIPQRLVIGRHLADTLCDIEDDTRETASVEIDFLIVGHLADGAGKDCEPIFRTKRGRKRLRKRRGVGWGMEKGGGLNWE